MNLKITLIFILFMGSKLFGQVVPYGLRIDKVQKEILLKTSEFDSLVLIDKSSYWNEDKIIMGFGFKGNEIYKVIIKFKKGNASSYDIIIDKIKKKQVTVKSIIDSVYSKVKVFEIVPYSHDSLNLHTRGGTYLDRSDQNVWTIVIIKNNNFILKQSYDPELYQECVPTVERQRFMEALIILESLLK